MKKLNESGKGSSKNEAAKQAEIERRIKALLTEVKSVGCKGWMLSQSLQDGTLDATEREIESCLLAMERKGLLDRHGQEGIEGKWRLAECKSAHWRTSGQTALEKVEALTAATNKAGAMLEVLAVKLHEAELNRGGYESNSAGMDIANGLTMVAWHLHEELNEKSEWAWDAVASLERVGKMLDTLTVDAPALARN